MKVYLCSFNIYIFLLSPVFKSWISLFISFSFMFLLLLQSLGHLLLFSWNSLNCLFKYSLNSEIFYEIWWSLFVCFFVWCPRVHLGNSLWRTFWQDCWICGKTYYFGLLYRLWFYNGPWTSKNPSWFVYLLSYLLHCVYDVIF